MILQILHRHLPFLHTELELCRVLCRMAMLVAENNAVITGLQAKLVVRLVRRKFVNVGQPVAFWMQQSTECRTTEVYYHGSGLRNVNLAKLPLVDAHGIDVCARHSKYFQIILTDNEFLLSVGINGMNRVRKSSLANYALYVGIWRIFALNVN